MLLAQAFSRFHRQTHSVNLALHTTYIHRLFFRNEAAHILQKLGFFSLYCAHFRSWIFVFLLIYLLFSFTTLAVRVFSIPLDFHSFFVCLEFVELWRGNRERAGEITAQISVDRSSLRIFSFFYIFVELFGLNLQRLRPWKVKVPP